MRFVKLLGVFSILLSSALSANTRVDLTRVDNWNLDEHVVEVARKAEQDAARDALDHSTGDDCDSWGSYVCPRTGEAFDYDPPRCGGFTKPAAKRACEAACAVACKDQGWQ
ncbi:hypothetical protein [Oligoflexus tunisiensis]|uniref:hypothetical protein n=1 Tax=Oligoflexus tunisiensis TaxID=708132 RepID=UPI00114D12A3|nr:hypothetical protein [Oligoflexus tunisiensis]